MADNVCCLRRRNSDALECLWRDNVVYQQINVLGVPDEIFGDARVSGKHDGPAGIIDPEAERRLHRRVVHFKRSDLHPAAFIYDTLGDVLGQDHDAVWWCSIVVQSKPNIILECLREERHHALGPGWPPHLQWSIPAWPPHKPTGQPQVRKTDHVVRM